MFAEAYAKASGFTKPVITSGLREDGTCVGGIASFVVVNADGWILTACHVIQHLQKLGQAKREYADFEAQKTAILGNAGLKPEQRKREIRRIPRPTGDVVKDYSAWWAIDGARLADVQMIPTADLAVGRLDPFPADFVSEYPTFKDPARPVRSGTSLCRLGFPFHKVTPSWDNGRFTLPPEAFPVVFFPNEGILTRVAEVRVAPSPGFLVGFIETSSPGLRGQSGGPVFDQQGTVWGIQSRTIHLALGFSPPVPGGKPDQKEHQFLNAGWAVHPATIAGLLNQVGVRFAVSDY